MTLNQIKFLFFFYCLSLSITLNAQSSLEIEVLSCHASENSSGYISSMKLYQNHSLITVLNRHEIDAPIKNLKPGKYRLDYTSIFGKKKSISFEIEPRSKKKVTICADYIEHEKEAYIPFIDQLENKESYSIELFATGCFHFSKDTITISKIKDTFFLTYKENKKELKEEEIQQLRFFEIELNALLGGGGCTSSTSYTLVFKDKVFEKTDSGCNWNGLYFFMETLKEND